MAVPKLYPREAPASSPEVFDRAHLAHYTMNNAELEREIIELFLAQLPVTIDLVHEAESHEEWRLATHTLKGAAAAVGACRLKSVAVALESLSPNADAAVKALQFAVLAEAAAEFEALVRHIYP